MDILIMFFSLIIILFLPGFFISLVFFSRENINLIERIAFSFALSIALVPLIVFYTNLAGIPITPFTILMYVVIMISIAGGFLAFRKWRKHHE